MGMKAWQSTRYAFLRKNLTSLFWFRGVSFFVFGLFALAGKVVVSGSQPQPSRTCDTDTHQITSSHGSAQVRDLSILLFLFKQQPNCMPSRREKHSPAYITGLIEDPARPTYAPPSFLPSFLSPTIPLGCFFFSWPSFLPSLSVILSMPLSSTTPLICEFD